MRSLLLASVLGVLSLGLIGLTPSDASARWYPGYGWGGYRYPYVSAYYWGGYRYPYVAAYRYPYAYYAPPIVNYYYTPVPTYVAPSTVYVPPTYESIRTYAVPETPPA